MKKREMEREIINLRYESDAFRAVFFKELGKVGELDAFKKVFYDKLAELFDMRVAICDELKQIYELKKEFATQLINGRDKQANCNDDGNGECKR